jgi:glucose-6-phosphate isomerase
VTDPGSPLEMTARDMQAHLVLADPDVGGRYSALTAFGLVPSALAGVNVAEAARPGRGAGRGAGPGRGRQPGAGPRARPIGGAARTGRDKLALIDDGTGITGLGDWIEQLVAESTGKLGTGHAAGRWWRTRPRPGRPGRTC